MNFHITRLVAIQFLCMIFSFCIICSVFVACDRLCLQCSSCQMIRLLSLDPGITMCKRSVSTVQLVWVLCRLCHALRQSTRLGAARPVSAPLSVKMVKKVCGLKAEQPKWVRDRFVILQSACNWLNTHFFILDVFWQTHSQCFEMKDENHV